MATSRVTTFRLPTTIPGCQLWLDAADPNGTGVVPSDGASISTWVDKSGNGRNATGYNSPTYSSSGITLNGTNQYFTCPDASYRPLNFFGVVSSTAGGGIIRKGYATGSTFEFDLDITAATTFRMELRTASAGQININSTVSTTLGRQLYGVTYNNTTGVVYYNATSVGSGSATGPMFTGTTLLALGVWLDNVNVPLGVYFTGSFQELLFYTTPLSDAQRQQVEGYLAWKWGLTVNLPANHPYKTSPPVGTPLSVPTPMTNVRFAPTQISGCSLWLDAADTTSLVVSGSTVSQWRDKSGSGNNANAFATGPQLQQTIQNNLPGLYFSGTNAMSAGNIATGTVFSLFVIVRYTNITSDRISVGVWKVPYSSFLYFSGRTSLPYQTIVAQINTTTNYTYIGLDTLMDTNTHLKSAVLTSDTVSANGSLVAGLDGNTLVYTSSAGPNANTCDQAFTIGGLTQVGAPAYQLIGYIHEVVLYKAALSTPQRQQVEGYLAWKWGLVGNLPAGHPYKTPPFLPFLYGVTRAVQRTWLPTRVSGCSLWLDAADTSSVVLSAANVSQWNDKSGNGRNAIVSSNAFASYSNAGLYFANSLYTTTLSADPTNETSFLVFNNPSGAGNGCIIGAYNGGRQIANYNANTTIGILKSQIQWGPFTTFPSFGTRYIATSIISPSATTILVNGGSTSNSISAISFTSGGNTLLGREAGLNFGVTGFLHEFVVYNSVLATNQRQEVEGYLAWKWGLQASLPANHPFKYAPPPPP